MLRFQVTHPALLASLAAAGHGSRILIADANYPVTTATNARADRIFLNLCPGVVDAATVAEVVVRSVPVEYAAVMEPAESIDPPIWSQFARILTPAVPLGRVGRDAFYDACRSDDLALVIATGETALFANLLLTVGVCDPDR